jgi:hypothetical protein
MLARGHGFLGAALLLREKGGYEFVVLHLVCQGLEIILKALLLFKDYDHYRPRLGKGSLRHNLEDVVRATAKAFGLKYPREPLAKELRALSSWYQRHLLRYATSLDIVVNPSTIPSQLVLRRTAALLRLTKKLAQGNVSEAHS